MGWRSQLDVVWFCEANYIGFGRVVKGLTFGLPALLLLEI
jgi:tetrahydromethanopterin S-methyltransferase subunit E